MTFSDSGACDLRIVEIVPSLAVGGAERLVSLLSQQLARSGHSVAIVSLFDPAGTWIEAELRLAGIPIVYLGKRPGLDPRIVPRLVEALAALRPDILHTHLHTLKYTLLARALGWAPRPARGATADRAAGARCNVVHTVHNLAGHEADLPSRLVHGAAFRRGVEPVAIGGAVAASIHDVYGIRPRYTIPNGIPVADYRAPPGARAELRAALRLPARAPTFITVGRLDPQKNHAGLLTAFADPALRAHDARLLVVGEGELRPALERQAEALGLGGRVRFLGVRPDIPRVLAAADVFVLASRWEGNPLVILEAMAAGLPVVATAVGSVPELVSATTGRLVVPEDTGALARAMGELAADVPLARALGVAAAAAALARFDIVVTAEAYAQVFSAKTQASSPK